MEKDIKEVGLYHICSKLYEFAKLDEEVHRKFRELEGKGEITIDRNFDVSNHPEMDQLIFENKDYVARLREGIQRINEFYQEFERRLKEYKG